MTRPSNLTAFAKLDCRPNKNLTKQVKCSKLERGMVLSTLTVRGARILSGKQQTLVLTKSIILFRPRRVAEWHRAKLAAV